MNQPRNCLGCVPVSLPSCVFHLLFLPDCKAMGFYLGDSQSPSRTPTTSGFSIFTSLPASSVMKNFQTQILQNVDFCFPFPSMWFLPPSQVEPGKICWWKHRLPIKKCLEEVSLSTWYVSWVTVGWLVFLCPRSFKKDGDSKVTNVWHILRFSTVF